MGKFLQGKYTPKFPQKYKGNVTEIIYRSSWERRFCKYFDLNANVLEWSSEEIVIPYRSPIDGKVHRYFPDFYVKMVDKDGKIQKYIFEIKPKKKTSEPKTPKRKTRGYFNEVFEYVRNTAKWDSAKEFCKQKNLTFKILTEDHLP